MHKKIYIVILVTIFIIFPVNAANFHETFALEKITQLNKEKAIINYAKQKNFINNNTPLAEKYNQLIQEKIALIKKSAPYDRCFNMFALMGTGSLVGCIFLPTTPIFFFTSMFSLFALSRNKKMFTLNAKLTRVNKEIAATVNQMEKILKHSEKNIFKKSYHS